MSRPFLVKVLCILATYICFVILPSLVNNKALSQYLILAYIFNIGGLIINFGKEWEIRMGKTIHPRDPSLKGHWSLLIIGSLLLTLLLYISASLIPPTRTLNEALFIGGSGYIIPLFIFLGLIISGISKLLMAFCQRSSRSGFNFFLETIPLIVILAVVYACNFYALGRLQMSSIVLASLIIQLLLTLISFRHYYRKLPESKIQAEKISIETNSYKFASFGTIILFSSAVVGIIPSIFLDPIKYSLWSYGLKLSFCISLVPSILSNQLPNKVYAVKDKALIIMNSTRKKSLIYAIIFFIIISLLAKPILVFTFSNSANIQEINHIILGIYFILLAELVNGASGPNDFILAFKGKQKFVVVMKALSLSIYALIVFSILQIFNTSFNLLALSLLVYNLVYNLTCSYVASKCILDNC